MSLFNDSVFDEPATKRCRKCNKRKPFDQFSPNKTTKDGRHPRCKACMAELARVGVPITVFPSSKACIHCKQTKPIEDFYRRANQKDGHQASCKECCRGYTYQLNLLPHRKAMKRVQWMRRAYKMAKGEYEALLAVQEGKCAICEASSSGTRNTRRLFIDHDHETGKVRGLLCHQCNCALGYVKDSTEVLTKAIRYLEKHRDTEG